LFDSFFGARLYWYYRVNESFSLCAYIGNWVSGSGCTIIIAGAAGTTRDLVLGKCPTSGLDWCGCSSGERFVYSIELRERRTSKDAGDGDATDDEADDEASRGTRRKSLWRRESLWWDFWSKSFRYANGDGYKSFWYRISISEYDGRGSW
jgi:hypothetical protein